MKMLIKVGTMPVGNYFIKYKRKLPKVGDMLYIKDSDAHGTKWESVCVWKYCPMLDVLFVEKM
jgi:hypothetical protein